MKQPGRGADIWAIVIKAALLVFGVIGQIVTFDGKSFMSSKMLMFYTNQSNWVIMAVTAVTLVYAVLKLCMRERAPAPGNGMMIVRFSATVAITLTFVVFSLLLTPEMLRSGNAAYLTSMSNLCVHNLVPLLAILDWCLFGYPIETKKGTFLWCSVMPLYYCAFALIISTTSDSAFGEQLKVPYFFFDYEKSGWLGVSNGLGVVWWILILCVAVLAMGYGLLAVARAVRKKRDAAVPAVELPAF